MADFSKLPDRDMMPTDQLEWHDECHQRAKDMRIEDYRWSADCDAVRIRGNVFEYDDSGRSNCGTCDASDKIGIRNGTGNCCGLVPLCIRDQRGRTGVYKLRKGSPAYQPEVCRAARNL